jgi:hypothetical protein
MKKISLLLLLSFIVCGVHAQVTYLDESFNTCNLNVFPSGDTSGDYPADSATNQWSVYNVTGLQYWYCQTKYGVGAYPGGPSIEMNGYGGGGDNTNEDWLITPKVQLSTSGYTSVFFNFYAAFKFNGDTIRLKASTNYVPGTNPDSAIYTWTNVACTPSFADSVHSKMTLHTADVSNFIDSTSGVYFAFEYISTDTNGSRWTLDSVFTSTTRPDVKAADSFLYLGVGNVANTSVNTIQSLGATTHGINLGYSVQEAGAYQLCVYDMAGRAVFQEMINAQEGNHTLPINVSLSTGVYVIKLGNSKGYAYTKASVTE